MVASEQTVVTGQQLDTLCINTIRTLAMDAVQQANSGHPGAPMGLAPVAYELWQEFLRYDTENPLWPNRDRFVLSAGHASMLLYATLHLAGVRAVNKNGEVTRDLSVSLEQIKRFQQLDSRTPGHPESHITTGVETTTGPLGQGAGKRVGMAIAERWLAANYNRPGFEVFNYNVYGICGDGDLMEGVAGEAASLAGHLRLSNLCWIYDNNKVTLDGPAWWSFSEDVMTRFVGYGWNVTRVSDANDLPMLARAFRTFLEQQDKPTLIVVDSHIGYGSPHKQDSSEAHGEPLGEEEVRLTKKNYGWPEDAKFLVPEGVLEHFREGIGRRGRELSAQWEKKYADYSKKFPELAALMETPVIYVFTHDSIGLGEDGPTHQPIEQLASLRAVPNVTVLRPGDANEVVEAWKIAVANTHGPVLLVLSRQAMPTLDRTKYAPAAGVARGAYVLADPPRGEPEVILIATGSEVSLCVAAYEELTAEGLRARVVSMPSWEIFEKQDRAYKEAVLPPAVTARVSVEMGATLGWERHVGLKGQMVGMHSFGASAPWKGLQKKFGFTAETVVAAAQKAIAGSR